VSQDSLLGTVVGGYTLHTRVGEGGTATVYRAEHPSHGTVAVKVLRERLRQDKTAVARFVREAEFGIKVVHPNVVKTLEIGEASPGMHFLAIEWAEGEILDRYAKRRAPLPLDEAVVIVQQIADAVAAAHAAGIVHRDLKPENLMYDPETRRVKLLDFGIAASTDTSPNERLTRAGFFVGTLMYVAPEALSGELVGPAADQYSLATIAYYLLAGVLPYTARNPREMFTQLLSQPPIRLNDAKPNLKFPDAVEGVVMKGLSKAPGDRYADVRAFAQALGAAVESAPKEAAGLVSRLKGLFGGRG
jgi:serine/threonine protein kinase